MKESYTFGKFIIPESQIFWDNESIYGVVNLKYYTEFISLYINRPIAEGHVMLVPHRNVERYSQLTTQEIAHLWKAAYYIGNKLQICYNRDKVAYCIQDGIDSGNSSVLYIYIYE